MTAVCCRHVITALQRFRVHSRAPLTYCSRQLAERTPGFIPYRGHIPKELATTGTSAFVQRNVSSNATLDRQGGWLLLPDVVKHFDYNFSSFTNVRFIIQHVVSYFICCRSSYAAAYVSVISIIITILILDTNILLNVIQFSSSI
jgi:hypothetical protein